MLVLFLSNPACLQVEKSVFEAVEPPVRPDLLGEDREIRQLRGRDQ